MSNLKCIYEFWDNCSGQYKSKASFKILSESEIPIMRNFFCEKHGKSVGDGTVGRTNQFVHCAITTKNEVIPNAHALDDFFKSQLEIEPPVGACNHYQQHFFFIESIDRSTIVEANTLQDTGKVHSIWSVGIPGVVEVWESSCACENCRMGQGECVNRHFVLGWETQNLLSRRCPQRYINHWNSVYPKCDVHDVHDVCDVCDNVAGENHVDSCPQTDLPIPETPCAESQSICPSLDNKVTKTCKNKDIESLQRLPDLDFWTSMQKKLSKCTSYEEIRQIVTSEDRDYHMPITSLTYLNDNFIMELIATHYYPSDTPSHITPVRCYGNGNRFMRSISKLVFGTECHH